MCAEAVWWRCHRRLVSDDFVARGWAVLHIMGPGKLQPHELNPDARMVDGHLVYPPHADQHELFGHRSHGSISAGEGAAACRRRRR
jgi:uncharacterized protein (DUF488 family)